MFCKMPLAPSGAENLHGLFEAGDGIAALSGRILMADIAGEVELGDGLRDEAVVELVGLVDFVAPGVAAGVEMRDVLEMVANVAHDVAIHDLGVIDVEQDLDAW